METAKNWSHIRLRTFALRWAKALLSPAILAIPLLFAGCSAKHYQDSADKEAYGVIREKSPLVRNADTNFTIGQAPGVTIDAMPVSTNAPDFLGVDAQMEQGAHILRLEDALTYAVRQSRNYQNQKENLYISALGLTLARHEFAPIFSASGTAAYVAEAAEGSPAGSDNIIERQQISGTANARADWLIRDIGRVTTAFTTDALRFVVGDRSVILSSELSATFTRPLLRNAGFKVEMEQLTQAERSLLYDLRDFVQFRRDFSVEVATAYYGVLGSRDTVRNSFLNLQSSRINAERSRALAQEGRITQSDLGRLEQQELSAESAWINAVRTYKQNLDSFKLLLGLSVDTQITLDDSELASLKILDPALEPEEAIRVALASRLDYINAKDRLEDTERGVKLQANLLKPQVDLIAGAGIRSDPNEGNRFALPDPERYNATVGLALDPGLDRKAQRNAYRTALITKDRAARGVVQLEDEIKLGVRNSWRTLDQAKRSYQISAIGVKLAERRVEEQNLLAEIGRAKAQDQVDAQNALIDSKNQLTQALVTHSIARLQFWNRLGVLYIKPNGLWEETQDAQTN